MMQSTTKPTRSRKTSPDRWESQTRVVVSSVVSPLVWVTTLVILLITPLMTIHSLLSTFTGCPSWRQHEAPAKDYNYSP